MDFTLSEDQRDLVAGARTIIDRTQPLTRLRAAYDKEADVELCWPLLVEQGLAAMSLPPEHGGLGWSTVDIALVMEECGFGCLPEPLLDHTVAVRLLAGSKAPAASHLLDALGEGSMRLSVLLPQQMLLHDAEQVAALLVCTEEGVDLVDREDLVLERIGTFDRSRLLSLVDLEGATRISLGGPELSRRTMELTAVLSAAELLGLARRLLEDTVAYVKQREQFGVPIGSFQAIKHALAECFRLAEVARPAVWEAALSHDAPDHTSNRAHIARALAIQAARQANECALQFHGGIGFAWENDLQFWLKRGKSLEVAYGPLDVTLDVIAAGLLD